MKWMYFLYGIVYQQQHKVVIQINAFLTDPENYMKYECSHYIYKDANFCI